jgi:diguanylate cyclase (GGDEF)-like protein
MSLRGKFCAALGFIAMLAIGLAAYGVHALNATGDLLARLYDEPLVGVNYAHAAVATLNEARGLMARGQLLDPGQLPKVVASLRREQADIAEDLSVVRQRVHAESIGYALNHAEASIAEWFLGGQMILDPSHDPVTSLPMPDAMDRQGAAAAAMLNDLVELVAANGYAYRERAAAEMRASSIALAGLSGAIVVASALVMLVFAHLVVRPIRAATRVAEDVAADRFAAVPATGRRDEIGRLLNSLAAMQASLRGRDARTRDLLREKERTAERLRKVNSYFDSALNNMSHGLAMFDADALVLVVNRRFCDMYRIAPGSIRPGIGYRELIVLIVAAGNYPGRTVDEIMAERQPPLPPGRTNTVRPLADGRTIAVTREPMPHGGWVGTYEDITERLRSEEQIVFLAHHDALTGLANRTLFRERVGHAFVQAARGPGFAMLYLDLDRFKTVNDTMGHAMGDSLLCAVASRVLDTVRETDTVGRLGGDEFAILQANVSAPGEANALASRIVEALGRPFDIAGERIAIGVSIGVTLAPGDGSNSVKLFRNADLALYRAKQEGRGTWRFFEPAMDAAVMARHTLELDLRDALPLGQLEVYFQPVICSRTLTVSGFETLLRWHHPTRGTVMPGEFISVAEEMGLIIPIGAWVLRQACSQAATWPGHIRVAVNVSSVQFRNGDLVATVSDAIRDAGIAPERVELEITESVMLQDDRATLAALHALHTLGVRIAMDDFGTGYSSLSYLRGFPFDTIKIDRSFVSGLETSEESVAIVRTITGLGQILHMDTTAEGVETEEQCEILIAAGCTDMQGYLFGRPSPASSIPAAIERLSRPVAVSEQPAWELVAPAEATG